MCSRGSVGRASSADPLRPLRKRVAWLEEMRARTAAIDAERLGATERLYRWILSRYSTLSERVLRALVMKIEATPTSIATRATHAHAKPPP